MPACRFGRSHWALESAARACLRGHWALESAARALLRATVRSKSRSEAALLFEVAVRSCCSKSLFEVAVLNHSSKLLVSVTLSSVPLHSVLLCNVHGMHGFTLVYIYRHIYREVISNSPHGSPPADRCWVLIYNTLEIRNDIHKTNGISHGIAHGISHGISQGAA